MNVTACIRSTLIKNKIQFSSYSRNSEGSGAKSYMTNEVLIYGENICAFPHIFGSPSSYMTLHPIPSPLYMKKILFSFYQCTVYVRPATFLLCLYIRINDKE
jgi:hypothetical protein